jgi:hypothetical protein
MYAIRIQFYNIHLGTSFFGPYVSEEEALKELSEEKGWIKDKTFFRNKWMEIFDVMAFIVEMKKLSGSSINEHFKIGSSQNK